MDDVTMTEQRQRVFILVDSMPFYLVLGCFWGFFNIGLF